MTVCRCGVDVKWVATPVGLVPIEPTITVTTGPDRYVVTDYAEERWRAEQLDPTSRASGHPDHRPRCPR